ncbi:hypothetical protein Sme01_36300 [Sphaerisporangium melleum]|uniref:DUF2637 domain-containing protein n=1 Tax=Sphaerisporangium melleum TaxID=321316 RepID=A0A917RQS0_9ACTN|nr:DUF2637 domain-containing protein [Sphaerisporangium melleum]GGL19186.1 hypothetical protein GCM10007964_71480 [Sphaerisporangium melleum]GII71154.1 hypothetical protein Sme01_36300 [Sphaerisporangium melleum]
MSAPRGRAARLGAWLLDSGPVAVVALIAGAGSFTHIRDTATQHGQTGWMAWAVAVCVDLTCVMAARERQRDKRTGRTRAGLVSWPTLVLAGGILLSLAANLAQAHPSVWGWVTAATPAAAFLVAVSMLERRAVLHRPSPSPDAVPEPVPVPVPASAPMAVPAPASSPAGAPSPAPAPATATVAVPAPSLVPASSPRPVPAADPSANLVPAGVAVVPGPDDSGGGQDDEAAPASGGLLDYARRVAHEHHAKHGKPITRDTLRARLGVSNQLATDLLRQLRTTPEPA